MNWLVSADLLSKIGKTVSMWGSVSLAGEWLNKDYIARQAFFDT